MKQDFETCRVMY